MSQTEAKRVVLKNVRLSFPSLFKKAVFNGKESDKYEATFLIKKDDPQLEILKKAGEDFLLKEFGTKDKIPKSLKRTYLVDGDTKDYDGYEGMMAVKAGTRNRPTVIDRDKTPLVEEDEKIYAGCYVNASVSFWYSDHELGGKQLLCNLAGVQFYDHGEPFGAGGVDATDDFDEIDDEF